MALQGSGAISLSQIAAEFGGSAPHSMSEYYGGGGSVPAGANPNVATSGAISMNSFYNGVAATVLNITSNVNNYDIGAQAIAAGGDKSTPVILTINSGVTVGSTASTTAAMFTGTGWSNGTTITITNNGSITGSAGVNSLGSQTGSGGNGGYGAGFSNTGYSGNGGSGSSGANGSGGSNPAATGGDAFNHSQTSDNYLSVIFSTAGTRVAGSGATITIKGGGGGGGGGGRSGYGCGGGGGGGANGGTGNTNGGTSPGGVGGVGQNGGITAGGNGGSQRAGSGGSLGSSGGSGGTVGDWQGSGGSGGSAGSSGGSASAPSGSVLSGNTSQIS